MWFATDRGLVKYDGYSFQTFTTKDGLLDNVTLGLFQDKDYRIWFYSLTKGVGYIKNGRIIIPSFNNKLINHLKNDIICSFLIDQSNTIWISSQTSSKLIKVDTANQISNEENLFPAHILSYIQLIDSNNLIAGNNAKNRKIALNELGLIDEKGKTNIPFQKKPSNQKKLTVTAINGKNGNIFYTQNNIIGQLYKRKNQASSFLKKEATRGLYLDFDGNLWVGMFNGGVAKYSNGDITSPPNYFLENYSVSSIYQDNQGGMWFTTLNSGIFYDPGLDFEIYSKQFGAGVFESISAIYPEESMTWLGTTSGKIYSYQNPFSNDSYTELISEGNPAILSLKKNKEDLLVSFSAINYNNTNNSKKIKSISKICYTSENEDSVWCCIQGMIPEDSYLPKNTINANINPNLRLKDITKWKDKFYIGTEQGLFSIEEFKSGIIKSIDSLNNYSITCLRSTDNFLIIGTKNNGIVLFNGKGKLIIDENEGLLTNYVEAIAIEEKSTLWIGGKKGINKVILPTKESNFNVSSYTNSDGLLTNEINTIAIRNGIVWVGTNKGLSYFKVRDTIQPTKALPTYINTLRVNGKNQDLKQKTVYSHNEIVYDFSFITLDFHNSDNIIYRYRLLGLDSNWHESQNRKVIYHLSHGIYKFEVESKTINQDWGQNQATYSFRIKAPFWKTWWFYLSIITGIISFVILIIYLGVKRLKEKNKYEVLIAKSQHQALSAQLKPHFIFNTLNSIYHYLLNNDSSSSAKYLTTFARLIRQILSNSLEAQVSLNNEIKMIKNYLEVEKMRFGKKMSFEVSIDNQINLDAIKVPTQIIQPFVENAIWHGIMHKESDGRVRIIFQLNTDCIICTIEDNGIGRSKSIEKENKGHKGEGIRSSRNRLQLIEFIYKKKTSIQINDIKDRNGKINGTRVVIELPIIN